MNNTNWFTSISEFGRLSLLRATPWMVDDSVKFLRNFCILSLNKLKVLPRILEFGAGAGTLFFASHSSTLVTIENDEKWYTEIKSILELFACEHCQIMLHPTPYAGCLDTVSGKFDIISIDGRDRVLCLKKCLELDLLACNGVLVIDNAERINGYGKKYEEMFELLINDFSMIHFEQLGMDSTGWNAAHRWITTIAFRKSEIQYTSQGAPL